MTRFEWMQSRSSTEMAQFMVVLLTNLLLAFDNEINQISTDEAKTLEKQITEWLQEEC